MTLDPVTVLIVLLKKFPVPIYSDSLVQIYTNVNVITKTFVGVM